MPRTDDVDLARAGLTDHAIDVWPDRTGLPLWRFRPTLLASKPAGRRLRRRVRVGMCPAGRWRGPTRVRVNQAAGVVFLLCPQDGRSTDAGRWQVTTVLPLDACRVCPEVADAAEPWEGQACQPAIG